MKVFEDLSDDEMGKAFKVNIKCTFLGHDVVDDGGQDGVNSRITGADYYTVLRTVTAAGVL